MAKSDKKSKSKKSPAKEQSLRDYAGVITVYAVILTIIFILMALKYWANIDILGGIGEMLQQA